MMKNYKIEELRVIAILMVLCAHFSLTNSTISLFGRFHFPFYLGADLFFVISGYFGGVKIICSNFNIFNYCKKRVSKLYPPFLLLILLTGILELVCVQLPAVDPTLYCDIDTYVRESVHILLGNLRMDYTCYSYGQFWYFRALIWLYVGSALLGWALNCLKDEEKKRKVVLVISLLLVTVCLTFRVSILFGNESVGEIFEVILTNKMDFYFAGIFCATLKIKRQIRSQYMYLSLIPPFVINIFTESDLSTLFGGKWLTSLGYTSAILFFSLALLIAKNAKNIEIKPWLKYISSRSYYMYVYNFWALAVSWLIIYYAWQDVFYMSPYVYGILQIVVGGMVLMPISEYAYKRFSRN